MLHNISRSKGNQTMKLGQFLEKSCTECGGKTSPRLFSKNSNLSIYLDQQSKLLWSWETNNHNTHVVKRIKNKVLCILLLLYVQVEEYQNI